MDPSQNFYSELLTGEGSTLYPSFYTEGVEEGHPIEFSQSATQQVSSQETPTTKKKKAYTRSENWTVHEDKLLVSAWLNTSQDAIQGTGQHKDKFWHRANDYFILYSTDPTSRTPNQMMHRWSTIQLSVNKFCGCVAQIEGRQRSGTGIIDQTAEVKELYQSLYGKPFVFDHCWVELRHHQKWIQQMESYNKIRSQPRRIATSDSSPNNSMPTTPIGLNIDSDDVVVRPEGRKAAKLKRKQNVESSGSATSIMGEAFAWMKQNANQKIELKQKKQDDDIMKMDLSTLNSVQRQYFEMRQAEILERWMSKGSS
ncbi:glutathione S-transferase T3-like [Asparagus officinalis]|uniref:glutathione S-transferase T3-like n=1 Tax=Asparagus officinalis TaxID=4686 RepID=UPI00098E52C5|nr:glutathione S-transferase T3-like [Asparagus officinalis]